MAYKDLQDFIDKLDKAGELIRVKTFVDPELEIAEVTDRLSKSSNNKALLFENTGKNFPVLINSMGSYRRMCLALGVDNLDDLAGEIGELFKKLAGPKEGILDKLKLLPLLGEISSWMPKLLNGKGACQAVMMETPDITQLPVLKCWPEDGGHFVTLPVINTIDPQTGVRNVGMYRMQVFGPTLTGMHWHKHKVSAGHFNAYKKLGKKMPVAVILGGDPSYTYAATAPLPPNVDEYMLAGFIRKKKVELVKCITQDLWVPADADFVIEGYVDPAEDLIWEGPFGDHTGYYSLADWYPKFHITCITHKKNAIYPATIVGIPPQEDAWIGKATERIFLAPIKLTLLPEIVDMELPIEGVFHNLTIVKIKKAYAGHGQKVMNAMWGAGQMMFNKILIVVDEFTDIHDYKQVAIAVSKNVDPAQDIYFSQGAMDVLDHSCSAFAFGGKMCIDATTKEKEELASPALLHPGLVIFSVPLLNALVDAIQTSFKEIISVSTALLELNIAALIVSIEKTRKGHVADVFNRLMGLKEMENIKFVLFVEHTVNAKDTADVIWRLANNLDPKRDHLLYRKDNQQTCIGLDGTRKSKAFDDFPRDWPNIICATDNTIQAVDQKWGELGLGPFIPSPSLKYKKQLYPGNAVVHEK